jgi:hypothetical protein
MSCCISPRAPGLSSGLTQKKVLDAGRRDQERILAQLQGRGTGACCKGVQNNKAALYASVLEDDHATRCQPTPAEQATWARVGVPESVRIQQTIARNAYCSINPFNPETRFAQYAPYNPPAPCPALSPELQSSTNPKPYFFKGCTPPPIGQRGY